MDFSKVITIPKWKVLWNVRRFMNDPIKAVNDSIKMYGDTYITYIGVRTKMIVTTNPELIQHVLQKNHSNYEKSEIQTELLAQYLGKGLLTTNGSYWLRQRRTIQPGFHKKKLNALTAIMQDEVLKYCNELEERIKINPVLDMSDEMMELTLRIASRGLFSTDVDPDNIAFMGESITRLQYAIIKDVRYPFMKWWRKMTGYDKKSIEVAKGTQQLLRNIISKRKESDDEFDDLLDMLLKVRYADDNQPMTDQQVLEESLVLITAGHETSANAMTWMHYLISQNDNEKKCIQEEVENNSIGNDPVIDEVMRLSYISNAVSESMRLYPPVWVTDRVALSTEDFHGLEIKKGDIISPYIYGAHNSESVWDNAKQFDPSRFNKDRISQKPSFSYFPFGGGPRLCIGQQFAMIEMQLIIYHLYKRFDFELMSDQKVDIEPLVTLRPRYGMKMRVSNRV